MDHPVPYLVFDRYIGKWADPDIGSDKWSKLGLWLHSSDSSLFGPFDSWVNGPNGPGSFILLNRYIGKWTESDIDVGIPLRRFLVRHVIVVLG